MYDSKQVCDKIVSMYPDIGVCGVDINVDYQQDEKAFLVDLKKGNRNLKHYLEVPDADNCIEGKQCVSLGLEIAQLKNNLEGQQF